MKSIFLAQNLTINNQTIKGPLDSSISTLGDLISKLLLFLIPTAGLILFFVLVWGGYDYMMSQGNAEKIKSAQGKITTGLIGFFLLIISYVAVRLIATIFGLGDNGII